MIFKAGDRVTFYDPVIRLRRTATVVGVGSGSTISIKIEGEVYGGVYAYHRASPGDLIKLNGLERILESL